MLNKKKSKIKTEIAKVDVAAVATKSKKTKPLLKLKQPETGARERN